MRWGLFFGWWLIGLLAWGQATLTPAGQHTGPTLRIVPSDLTPFGPVDLQPYTWVFLNPSGTYQPQRQIRAGTSPFRVSQSQPNHPKRQRIQMPKRTQATMPVLIFFSAALGAVLFMSLFTFAQYLLNRNAPYGWYALYLMTTAIWLWQSTSVWFNGVSGPPDLPVFFAYMLLLGYGMMVSYVRFIGYLLEVSQQHPRLERWTRYFVRFAALSVLVLLAELFIWNSTYVYIAINFLNYVGLLFLMVSMLRNRHPLKRYALAGSILLVSGAITATFLNYIGPETTDQLNRMPLFYLVVSQLLEILCFSLALGRRSYLNKVEKLHVQQQLIDQLEENQRLQRTHTVELEQQLAQRTREVQEQSQLLEAQRIQQLESEFEQKLADTEMTALRAQMNPHFIFNCLNSIKLYTLQNDADRASEYLTKFARLIRLVLDNSRSDLVPLRNELEALRLYIELEAMRFKQKVRFEIDASPGIDQQYLRIPPLLLQPFVENAIWHGLMHKPEGGTVTVVVRQPEEDGLCITITDDGIGRARAAALKSKSADTHKSFGMQVTADRIRMINHLYDTHARVTIHDLVAPDGQPAGTEVVLKIPV
ncbi:MAG: histidine kinase [Ferruginibacter sp.]|nr:histidine kinase [Cytophagales bacterium]